MKHEPKFLGKISRERRFTTKMKKTTKKLALKTETIRYLQADELVHVEGGSISVIGINTITIISRNPSGGNPSGGLPSGGLPSGGLPSGGSVVGH